LHHLRSALDNAVYEIASKNKVDKKALKRLQFPIYNSLDGWNKDLWKIECLPGDIIDYLYKLQPFQTQDVLGNSSRLGVLRDLSNEDKHQIQPQPLFNLNKFEHNSYIEFYSEEEAKLNTPPKIDYYLNPFKSSQLILRQITKTKINKIRGSIEFKIILSIQINKDQSIGLTLLIDNLSQYVENVLDNFNLLLPK
jgi:hypothetical protein